MKLMAKAKKITTNPSLQTQVAEIKAPSPGPIVGLPKDSLPVETQLPDAGWTANPPRPRWHYFASVTGSFVLVGLLLVGGFSLVYAGKIYPGVTANGVYLGGLTSTEATAALERRIQEYRRELISIDYRDTTIRVNPDKIAADYDVSATIEQALLYGREQGGRRWHQWLRTLVGRPTRLAVYTYDPGKLYPYLKQVDDEVNLPVKNASFNFSDGGASIDPAVPGQRLDIGRLTLLLQDRLARTSAETIEAPVYELSPAVSTSALTAARDQANTYLAGPITVKLLGTESVVEPAAIVGWIDVAVNQAPANNSTDTDIRRFYALPASVSIAINEAKIADHVAALAKRVDQPGQNAALTINDSRASIFRPSRDGIALNQAHAVEQIKQALLRPRSDRLIAADIKVTKPEITEESINNLGIKELLSEGISYFPGSTRERIQNVRVGAARFNGVLLKPGEVFSFGALLGDVGPETGYAPANVIIGNRQEKQYGGGLCQVSSTAFRAALNAGLPILERTNHSYAVSYYTAPYGVPGVDATIYYPQVDFKFKNDTEAYILIQTVMEGTTLKFQFYGTKTKDGIIRGPSFVTGSLDHTQPSHTVFYRDIIQNGQVIKTDTFHTYYQSSLKFPSTPQYNG
jgi:vancomycin resistance protein YoaR